MSFEKRINRTIEGGTLLSDAEQTNDRIYPTDIETSHHFLIEHGKMIGIVSMTRHSNDETQIKLSNGEVRVLSNNELLPVYDMREATKDTTSDSGTRP